jgi:hypothetical protein
MDNDTQTWLTRANTALIRYPRFKALHEDMRECQALSRLANEPHCLSLEGVTGAGKSTLVRDYAALFPRVEEPTGTRVPVFYVETPSPVTVKGMAATMLARLGDPAAHSGALWSMNFRLVRLMTACQVELVILDDFHHLIDKETNRVLEQVSDWLKVLIKETNIPFLVVGIEGKVECILEANAQLSRLFAARQTLEPLRYDQTDSASLQEFARFVHYAEEALAITLPETLSRSDLLQRLYVATHGVVGNLMNLLRYAAWLTRQQQHNQIALPTLAAAFDKRLSKHLKNQSNPFVSATTPPTNTTSTTTSPKRTRRTSIAEALK